MGFSYNFGMSGEMEIYIFVRVTFVLPAEEILWEFGGNRSRLGDVVWQEPDTWMDLLMGKLILLFADHISHTCQTLAED